MVICEYCGKKHRGDVDECRGCGAVLPEYEIGIDYGENSRVSEALHFITPNIIPTASDGYWVDGGNPTGYPSPSSYSEWNTGPIFPEARMKSGDRVKPPRLVENIKDVIYRGIFER